MNNRLRNQELYSTVTINDVARELGVSKTTISRAISGKGRIGAETRDRVLSYIKERGYQPNLIAKSLAMSRTFNIAVVLPADPEYDEIPFFQTCLLSIGETAMRRDYDVVLSVTDGQDIAGLERLVRNNKVDGFILTRPVIDDRSVKFLQQAGIPFVVIGSVRDESIIQVDTDHYAGCREVTTQVLDNGFRNIALLAGNPDHQVNKDRYAGFSAALAAQGIKPDGIASFWDMARRERIDSVLPSLMKKKPDCLVCMDDVICARVLAWLQRNGYGVPSDVKIVSFHDSAVMSLHNPPVTALHVKVRELGVSAGNLLLDIIDGKDVPRRNRVGYEFFVRESSRGR